MLSVLLAIWCRAEGASRPSADCRYPQWSTAQDWLPSIAIAHRSAPNDPQLTVADHNEHAVERSVAECRTRVDSRAIALRFDQVGHGGEDRCRRGGDSYLLLLPQSFKCFEGAGASLALPLERFYNQLQLDRLRAAEPLANLLGLRVDHACDHVGLTEGDSRCKAAREAGGST